MVTPNDYTGPSEFVHLNLHSTYSPLSGVASVDQYTDKAAELGHTAMAVTEEGNVASVPDAYFACKSKKMKYICGCVVYYNDYEPIRQEMVKLDQNVQDLRRTNVDLFQRISKNRSLTILCKNKTGFNNLIKLTTSAWKEGLFGRPRVWFKQLVEHKEGLIILSGGPNGPIEHELYLDLYSKEMTGETQFNRTTADRTYKQYVEMFKAEFGDDFYLELQMPCMPELYDDKIFRLQHVIAKQNGLKCVLTNAVHYLQPNDQELQKVMAAIQQGTYVDDPALMISDTDQLYYKSRAELWATYQNNAYSKQMPEDWFEVLCQNTLDVAEKCEKFDPDTSPKIPDWSAIEAGVDADKELLKIVREQLKERGLDKIDTVFTIDGKDVTYTQQAELECQRFIDKGFASYFLITQDLVKYGKSRGWPFGPRGSAGGSLVVYLLGITSINPMLWRLSFDRFMASSRGGYMLKVKMNE